MAAEISDIFDSESDDSEEEHREAQATVNAYHAQQKITSKHGVHVCQSVS